MSAKTATLSVNNILSFNGHGGKITSGDQTFTLPGNVYVLVPFGIDVDGVNKPNGSGTQKTDTTFKGLDVCYTTPAPTPSAKLTFEEIIYGKPGKIKFTFNPNVDAKWHLYKPGDQVPNVEYHSFNPSGDAAGGTAQSCNDVSTNYKSYISDLMNACLNSGNVLNKKVCAYFVSKSHEAHDVFTDSTGNYHLKLKICGDGTSATTTLKELAENCRDLVNFSRNFVKGKKSSGETYETGYDDNKIFPKSETDDPIILLPFICNSCGQDIQLHHNYTNDNSEASLKPLSDIIADLAGGGGGGGGGYGDPPSGKVAQFFMTFKDKSDTNGGLNNDGQAEKIFNAVKCLMTKRYKNIGLTYSANQAQTIKIWEKYKYNVKNPYDITSNCFDSGQPKTIAETEISGDNQAEVLGLYYKKKQNENTGKWEKDAKLSNPRIDTLTENDEDFRKVFRIIPFSTMASGGGADEVNVGLPGNVSDCIKAADDFLKLPDSIILGWCNQDIEILSILNRDSFNKDYTPDNAGKFPFAIGGGVGGKSKLPLLFKSYLGEYFKFLTSVWDERVQNIVTECSPNPKSASSTSSPPPVTPTPKETPSVEKKSFADVLTDLQGKLSKESVDFSSLGLTLPDFLYPLNGNDTDKKNLNSADPDIGDMIKEFETAGGGETNFYLGACRSIQAVYELEMKGITDSNPSADQAKMRAKLLLNLRKNSLLLKVPARWDYATMNLGVEPKLTEKEVKAKYATLQKECANLGQDGGAGYASEDAYKLAEQLIPLNEKMEIGVLEEKNKIVQKYYPDKEFVYAPPINITPGYTKIVTQESLNCGRAALANFFGVNGLLVKGDPSKNDEIFNLNDDRPKKEINMGSICNLRAKYAKLFNNYDISTDQCPDGENYSINVLNVVLQILGYQAGKHIVFSGNTKEVSKDNRDEANNTAKDKNTLGYLVNINKGHWICYKKANFNKSEDLFYRINSTKEIDEDAVSKTTYTINQLIDMDGGNNSSLYLSIYPITILTSPATNKSLFSDFTGAKIKDHYKKEIERIETAYNWYELMKKIMSKITEEEQYKTDENRIKIMAYLSKGSDEISPDVKKKILDFFNVDSNFKKKTINIFVENVKFIFDSLNDVKIDKTLKIEYIQKENEIYIPTGEAKIRYFYNLTNSTSYNKLTFDKKKILGDSHTGQFHNLYEDIYNEAVIGNIVSGGGFKPTHNTITTHTASKSKHNTSFKVSSSSKVKAKSRSHTQRVK